VAKVLIVSDARTVLDEVRAVVDDGANEVVTLRDGAHVRQALEEGAPDLLITDCQVQNMGGIAICLDVKLEESAGRAPHLPVLILLDRRADVFLARRSGAEGFLVKPLDPVRLRRAVDALLDGARYEDPSLAPATVPAKA